MEVGPGLALCIFILLALFSSGKSTSKPAKKSARAKKPEPAPETFVPELLMTYEDSIGDVTDREISRPRLVQYGNFKAFCHLRQEMRTFKVKRVIGVTDIATGEVLDKIPITIANGSIRHFNIVNR